MRLLPCLAIAFCAVGVAHAAQSAPRAVPTFHCIGLYWTPSEAEGAGAPCSVRFRAQGEDAWREGLPLWFDERGPEVFAATFQTKNEPSSGANPPQTEFSRAYRGSLVDLRPGTEYEIELALEGAPGKARLQAATWSEEFPIAETVVLPEFSRDPLVIKQSGTPQGYILYTHASGAETATIDVANEAEQCIEVRASYVILRGLTLKNGQAHGIDIDSGSHDVIIEDCDISGWGRPDRLEGEKWGLNCDSGIYAKDDNAAMPTIERLIIQRNRIHHPRYDTNSWDEYRQAMDPDRRDSRWHPNGPQGISLFHTGGNHVIRYNEIWSDEDHYYNDIIGGGSNYCGSGAPNRDSDIYGNRLEHCWDDAIEAEGGNCNVRIWGNYLNHCMVAIASASTHIGPLYLWRNIKGHSRWAPHTTWDKDKRGPFLKPGTRYGFGRSARARACPAMADRSRTTSRATTSCISAIRPAPACAKRRNRSKTTSTGTCTTGGSKPGRSMKRMG